MLEAIELRKTYGAYQALKGLNFKIDKGEVFCLLGQNGAGKTTMINIFLGLLKPTSGKAMINNIEVSANSAATNKLIAYIPEVVQLYGNLSGTENLDLFSRMAGFRYSQKQLQAFLEKSGLPQQVHSRPLSTYSKGMRQKVGISIALSKHAEVIFMDEPTSGLDPKATDEFTAICKELAGSGTSIFMATHDIFNAVNVGTRIGIMKEGELVHAAPTAEVDAASLQALYLKTI